MKTVLELLTKSLTELVVLTEIIQNHNLFHFERILIQGTYSINVPSVLNFIQGYVSGSNFAECSCGYPDPSNNFNMHALVWMFIIPFIVIMFSYGSIGSVIYNSTKRTSSHRERNASENSRSRQSKFKKIRSSSSIDPRTKRLLLLIIALVVRYGQSKM